MGSLRLVASGNVTLANMRLSLVDTHPFVDFSSAGALDYIDHYLVVKDSAGKAAKTWLRAPGTGETLGADIIDDADFTGDGSYWGVGDNWSYDAVDDEVDAVSAGASDLVNKNNITITVGAVYKTTITVNRYTEGNVRQAFSKSGEWSITGNWLASTTTESKYGTIPSSPAQRFCGGRAIPFTGSVNHLGVKQVLTPSATGATVAKTRGGAGGWEEIEAGFVPNDAAGYTYEIFRYIQRARFLTRLKGYR